MNNEVNIKFVVRFTIAAVFFIAGINFSNTLFFHEHPLFDVPFLAEIMISIAAALVGYFLVPKYFLIVKGWVEQLIVNTTYKLASDFWNQYTQKMEESRKQRDQNRQEAASEKFKKQVEGGTLVDTSVLIDGRLGQIIDTGFIPNQLIVPYFVVQELHTLSDSRDAAKRKKGRRGLDFLNEIKKNKSVTVFKKDHKDFENVDDGLVELAQEHNLSLMTLDYNLNKVAKVSNIKVLNLNELSEALKPAFIPGDNLTVKIVQEGKEKNQGVGFLADGTMIVVDKADALIDENVTVTVSKLIQTEAGKMVFCKLSK